ncbi:hypothetical protein D3C86_1421000 [compost metagenome]
MVCGQPMHGIIVRKTIFTALQISLCTKRNPGQIQSQGDSRAQAFLRIDAVRREWASGVGRLGGLKGRRALKAVGEVNLEGGQPAVIGRTANQSR